MALEGPHAMSVERPHATAPIGDHFGRLLPINSAAEYLGVSRATVQRLVHRGELAIVKIGGSTRYDVDDLDGYIDSNRRRNRTRTA
jgi:excisionase family DNA binding protein